MGNCGKLWEKYNSENKLFKTAKILSGGKKTFDSTSTPIIDSKFAWICSYTFIFLASKISFYPILFVVGKTQDRLTWLTHRICPWEQVIDNLKATCDARKITLTQDKSSLNYFKYPCVRCQRGVELVCN